MTRFFIALILFVGVTGCAPRGNFSYLPLPVLQGEELQRVYVATNRAAYRYGNIELVRQQFGDRRDPVLRFGRIDISVPPAHAIGQIEWPSRGSGDPSQHFLTRDGRVFETESEFHTALRSDAMAHSREIIVFVHGYNVNNAEALYRLAQIAHDFEAPVPVLAYSWASAGEPRGYVYDRDSVIFSRDGLEEVLTGLAQQNWKVTLIAHSMGSQLVMETLRQMSISGNRKTLRKIHGLALISPDIDEDVFVQQARRIHPIPQPFLLLVSTRDKALGLSAWLSGRPQRLGSIQNADRLGEMPVQVIDLSDISGGDRVGHSTAFTAPTAISMLREMQLGR
ncbi:MAG: alpha/beta fold hydrolase [Pelagimonas sp.]|jgi:esterase/lipase superfamily enzyme|nr:alpha/beta fold hydrolase [Pelagimonas sp.]